MFLSEQCADPRAEGRGCSGTWGRDRAIRGAGLRLQVEGEFPLLGEGGAAHLHRQTPAAGAPAVQTQVTAHVPQFRVVLNLLPFLQQKHRERGLKPTFTALQIPGVGQKTAL